MTRKYTPRKLNKFICDFCGGDFETRHHSAKFCSSKCRDKNRYRRNPEPKKASSKKYRLTHAELVREKEKIRAIKTRDSRIKYAQEYYKSNRDKFLATAAEYQKSNKLIVTRTRNMRRAAVSRVISNRDLQKLLQRHCLSCGYCKRKLNPPGRSDPLALQWEHVIPLSRGGWNSIGNIIPSCRECNINKGNKTVMEWRMYLRRIKGRDIDNLYSN